MQLNEVTAGQVQEGEREGAGKGKKSTEEESQEGQMEKAAAVDKYTERNKKKHFNDVTEERDREATDPPLKARFSSQMLREGKKLAAGDLRTEKLRDFS